MFLWESRAVPLGKPEKHPLFSEYAHNKVLPTGARGSSCRKHVEGSARRACTPGARLSSIASRRARRSGPSSPRNLARSRKAVRTTPALTEDALPDPLLGEAAWAKRCIVQLADGSPGARLAAATSGRAHRRTAKKKNILQAEKLASQAHIRHSIAQHGRAACQSNMGQHSSLHSERPGSPASQVSPAPGCARKRRWSLSPGAPSP